MKKNQKRGKGKKIKVEKMEDYEGGDSESADNQTESNGDKKLRKKMKGLKI